MKQTATSTSDTKVHKVKCRGWAATLIAISVLVVSLGFSTPASADTFDYSQKMKCVANYGDGYEASVRAWFHFKRNDTNPPFLAYDLKGVDLIVDRRQGTYSHHDVTVGIDTLTEGVVGYKDGRTFKAQRGNWNRFTIERGSTSRPYPSLEQQVNTNLTYSRITMSYSVYSSKGTARGYCERNFRWNQPQASTNDAELRKQLKIEGKRIALKSQSNYFAQRRAYGRPVNKYFDWRSDGCSVPIAAEVALPLLKAWSEAFRGPCLQHDFAGANFGPDGNLKLEPTQKMKNRIDDVFLRNMRRRCQRGGIGGVDPGCLKAATLFYLAVKTRRWD